MRRRLGVVLSLLAFTCLVGAGSAQALDWWVVCWKNVVVGVSASGKKVYCTKCDGPTPMENTGILPDNCKRFVGQRFAEDWMRNRCDCP